MNSGAGMGAGMATGLATGLAIGQMQVSEAEAEARRKSHIGTDQIVIEVKEHLAPAGAKIAKLHSDWYFRNGDIYRKGERPPYYFDFWAAFGGSFALVVALMIWSIITFPDYPFSVVDNILVVSAAFVLFGFFGGVIPRKDDTVDYIRLSTTPGGATRIWINIYDSSGMRNIDDDKILEIREMLTEVGT